MNRHVDAIEAAFGTTFFQRHARGYTLTEAGRDLLDVASRRPTIMPAIQDFSAAHPETNLVFIADENLARLEYGEAHVAIRAGSRPLEADYVVLPFRRLRLGLFAAKSYIERFGMPEPEDLARHRIVGEINGFSRLPCARWMVRHFAQDQIALRTSDRLVIMAGVHAGLELGFLAEHDAKERPDVVEVVSPQDDWSADLWIVTHVDLHRTQKVQEFMRYLKPPRGEKELSG